MALLTVLTAPLAPATMVYTDGIKPMTRGDLSVRFPEAACAPSPGELDQSARAIVDQIRTDPVLRERVAALLGAADQAALDANARRIIDELRGSETLRRRVLETLTSER